MYGIVLDPGGDVNDLARFVNPRLLMQDWPLLRSSLDPKLRTLVRAAAGAARAGCPSQPRGGGRARVRGEAPGPAQAGGGVG